MKNIINNQAITLECQLESFNMKIYPQFKRIKNQVQKKTSEIERKRGAGDRELMNETGSHFCCQFTEV
jgi:hypothetical protein